MPVDAGLSDLLPVGDPYSDFDPKPYVGTKSTEEINPSTVDQSSAASEPGRVPPTSLFPKNEQAPEAAFTGHGLSNPAQAAPRRSKRRRRSWSGVFLAGIVAVLFAGLVGCLILLVNGNMVTTDGELVSRKEGDLPKRPLDTSGNEKPPLDPVMGKRDENRPKTGTTSPSPRRRGMLDPNLVPGSGVESMDLGGDKPAMRPSGVPELAVEPQISPPPSAQENALPGPENAPTGSPSGNQEDTGEEEQEKNSGAQPEKAPQQPQSDQAQLVNPQPMDPEGVEVEVPTQSASPPSPQQWNEELEEIGNLLRGGAFAEAQLRSAALPEGTTPEDNTLRTGYSLLAELAEYYAEGIRQGAETLKAAETLELPGGITVAVVESNRDSIALKIEGRVRRYSIVELPLVLADRIAAIGLPTENPVAQAGRGAYYALWPHATAAHRSQAFAWWSKLPSDEPGLDPEALLAAVRHLFPNPGVE